MVKELEAAPIDVSGIWVQLPGHEFKLTGCEFDGRAVIGTSATEHEYPGTLKNAKRKMIEEWTNFERKVFQDSVWLRIEFEWEEPLKFLPTELSLSTLHLVITQRGGGGYGYLVDFFNVKRGPKLLEICVITKLMPSDIELFWTAEFWSR